MFELPEEELFIDVEGEVDVFVAKMLGKKHYEGRGFLVLKGDDFENDMLLGLTKNMERRYLDKYDRMKIGRARSTDFTDRYLQKVAPVVPSKDVEMLLYLCRFCSYLGGPGFPDLLVIDPKSGKWFIRHPKQDITDPYIMFVMLASMMGYDAKLLNVMTRDMQDRKKAVVDQKEFIERILDENKHIWVSLDGEIEKEEEKAGSLHDIEKAICEDFMAYLKHRKHSMPFHVLGKWLDGIRIEDIRKAERLRQEEYAEDLAMIQKIVSFLKNDGEYQKLGVAQDEQTLRRKAEYFRKTFYICEARARDVLNFLLG